MRVRWATLAWVSMGLCAGLAVWGWSIVPERGARFLGVALFLPGLWGFLELMQGGNLDRHRDSLMNFHRGVIAGTGFLLAAGLAPRLAIASGLLDPGWEPVLRRTMGVLLGVALAIWGNYLPKMISPWSVEHEPFDWQRVHRFCGWVASLSGIALASVWLLLPQESAKPAAATIVVTFLVLCLVRKFFSVATHSPDVIDPSRR